MNRLVVLGLVVMLMVMVMVMGIMTNSYNFAFVLL